MHNVALQTSEPSSGVDQLRNAAMAFSNWFRERERARIIHVPDYVELARQRGTLKRSVEWTNWVTESDGIRRAHVEFFSIAGQIGVLHVCVFPHLENGAPIFGFDVVSGHEKTTGVFFDLSPTTKEADEALSSWATKARVISSEIGTKRDLPDWGSIFSDHVIAVRPHNLNGVAKAVSFAFDCLDYVVADYDRCSPSEMHDAQSRYISGQQKNIHTQRMLANCVGDDLAGNFIEEVLFPLPG